MTQPVVDQSNGTERKWGRVLICGGTDWANLGRAKKSGGAPPSEDNPDLPHAHILRSLANVKAVSVHTSHSGCHVVVLDIYGTAYLFGRNASSCLGVHASAVPVISERTPRKLRPSHLGAPSSAKFVNAACGRAHTLLVDDNGDVWSAGLNTLGQCGHSPRPEVLPFKKITGPWNKGGTVADKVISASCGITFSLVLTESGKVYSFGSAEYGQLGNGRTGEHIATGNKSAFDIESEPIRVRNLENKKIVQISCGQQHSIALDDNGFVYVWGTGGYCRTGLGNPKDQLLPVAVPKFANDAVAMRGEYVLAGVTCSAVIDRQGMYWLAGKWKNSGDGSGGQPFSNFRILQDIMSCRMLGASCGGVTQFCFCPSEEDSCVMTVGWGQNANNFELGLGDGLPKSATKPQEIFTLKGIDVFQIAAGAHTSFFLARPNDKLSDLDRYPEVDSPEVCTVCHIDKDDEGADLLECEKCETPYHLSCLDPPLSSVPEGEWFCAPCTAESDSTSVPAPPDPPAVPAKPKEVKVSPKKRARPEEEENGNAFDEGEEEEEEDDDDDDDDERPSKRGRGKKGKAGAKGSRPTKKRK